MNFKKVAIKTEETTIKRTTQTIEMDFDFTQVYDCMYSLSFSLRSPSSFQILFYLLKNVSSDNVLILNSKCWSAFNEEMISHTGKGITEQTFYRCIKELTNAKIMSRLTKGQYFLNPYILWKDDKDKRVEFLSLEELSKNGLAYNPKDNLNYLKEGDVKYISAAK